MRKFNTAKEYLEWVNNLKEEDIHPDSLELYRFIKKNQYLPPLTSIRMKDEYREDE